MPSLVPYGARAILTCTHNLTGHYTAFAREWNELGEMGRWSLFDDSTVSLVHGNNVVSQAAYVLFYRRRPTT